MAVQRRCGSNEINGLGGIRAIPPLGTILLKRSRASEVDLFKLDHRNVRRSRASAWLSSNGLTSGCSPALALRLARNGLHRRRHLVEGDALLSANRMCGVAHPPVERGKPQAERRVLHGATSAGSTTFVDIRSLSPDPQGRMHSADQRKRSVSLVEAWGSTRFSRFSDRSASRSTASL